MQEKTLNDIKNMRIAQQGSWLYEMLEENQLDKFEKQQILKSLANDFKEKKLEELRLEKEEKEKNKKQTYDRLLAKRSFS